MLEFLPWIIGGLAVGLFVGYAFGRYKGANEASEARVLDEKVAEEQPASAAARSSSSEAESGRTVYIRRGGSHYHKEGCTHLRRRGGQPMSETQAVKKGFRRCPHCRP